MQTLLVVGFLKFLQIHKACKISVPSPYKTSPEPHFWLSIACQNIRATLPLRRPKFVILHLLGRDVGRQGTNVNVPLSQNYTSKNLFYMTYIMNGP